MCNNFIPQTRKTHQRRPHCGSPIAGELSTKLSEGPARERRQWRMKRPQRLGRHLPLHKQSAGQRLSANPEISGKYRISEISRPLLP